MRGTKVSLYDQRPFPAQAVSLTGRAEFRDFKKHNSSATRMPAKPRLTSERQRGVAALCADRGRSAHASGAFGVATPLVCTSLLSRGATVSFDYDKGIRVVTGGTVPRTDNELIPTLPGSLNFVMRWTGNSDVNLGVVEPGNGTGHTIYPLAGSDLLASGGQTSFDHRGGPNGGIEVAFYPGIISSGRYFVGAQLISGPDAGNGGCVPRWSAGAINVGDHAVLTAEFIAAPVNPSLDVAGIGVGVVTIDPGGTATAQSLKKSTKTQSATITSRLCR